LCERHVTVGGPRPGLALPRLRLVADHEPDRVAAQREAGEARGRERREPVERLVVIVLRSADVLAETAFRGGSESAGARGEERLGADPRAVREAVGEAHLPVSVPAFDGLAEHTDEGRRAQGDVALPVGGLAGSDREPPRRHLALQARYHRLTPWIPRGDEREVPVAIVLTLVDPHHGQRGRRLRRGGLAEQLGAR